MNIPSNGSEITPEWLTAALRDAGHLSVNGAVASLRLEPLKDAKAVFGALYRLHLSYDGDRGQLPSTMIAKGPSPNRESVAIMQRIGGYRQETQFYRLIASEAGLRTPVCYVSLINENGNAFILLLEDLSSFRQVEGSALSAAEIEATVRGLAAASAACWRKASLSTFDWLRNVQTDTKTYHENFVRAWSKISKRLVSGGFDDKRLGAEIAECFLRNHDLLGADPQTLLLTDVRAENLFFADTAEGVETIFIDFQFLRVGRGPISLSSFLATLPERQVMEEGLVRLYYACLRDGGIQDYSLDECFRDYWRGVIRRFVGMAGILATVDPSSQQGKAVLEVLDQIGPQDMTRYADLLSGT